MTEKSNNEHSALAALEAIEKQIKELWDQTDKEHCACSVGARKDELAGRCREYHVALAIVTNEKRKLKRCGSSE